MLGFPDRQVGDTWFFIDKKPGESAPPLAHCYYLTCPKSVERHSRWSIGHATSPDLTHWTDRGPILEPGQAQEFDGRCPATGSVLRLPAADSRGRFVMAYTGNWGGPEPTVGLAFSPDLHRWTKGSHNPVTQLDEHFYTRYTQIPERDFPHWRDPFLFEHQGWTYHAVCAARKEGPTRALGTIGLARSVDLDHWEVLPPPDIEPVVQEMECPQLHHVQGWWVLLFSAQPGWFSPEAFDRLGQPTSAGMFALISREIFGPYLLPKQAILEYDRSDVNLYAGQAVCFDNQWWMLGTTEQGIHSVLDDPKPLSWRLPRTDG